MKRAGGERLGFKNTPRGSSRRAWRTGGRNYLVQHASQHANPSRPDGQVHAASGVGGRCPFPVVATDLSWGSFRFRVALGLDIGPSVEWSDHSIEFHFHPHFLLESFALNSERKVSALKAGRAT
ncbi:hypothetical protein AVEN_124717-1 [Araneus ventricosus]|uniref:Uncharacterized protein n=1 Tax=Araneus ventricosus TaxID=182803 RepID=A0A4Y2H0M5_ARAVE|nr:hypothetical protein AVEN_124717-1 [Araneus ventricosus]